MGLNIFISYLECDKPYVVNLQKQIKKIDEKNKISNVFIVPKEDSFSILNSEKIKHFIDSSQIFISIMSDKALIDPQSNWIHQELGYACNHMQNSNLRILVLWENRDNIKGFINPACHDLSIKKDTFKVNAKQILKIIFGDDMKAYKYPISIMKIEEILRHSGVDRIFEIPLDNIGYSDLDHAVMDVIVPIPSLFKIRENPISIINEGVIDDKYCMKSNKIPENIKSRFNKNEIEKFKIDRYTMHLKTLHSYNMYETYWTLEKVEADNLKNSIKFVIILKLPIHGIDLYQGVLSKSNGNGIFLQINHMNENEKGKISYN